MDNLENVETVEAIENVESAESSFSQLGLREPVVAHLTAMGFVAPTDIQTAAIPVLLSHDGDFIGLASTGTGKTAAFGIPLIEKIHPDSKKPRALILCPTRELAGQVAVHIQKLADQKKLKVAVVYGGSSYQTQIRALQRGAQIVVATPGRLIDLMEQKLLSLDQIEHLVLDEADEMLSMGFQDALNTIMKAMRKNPEDEKAQHNIWLFSATMSEEIKRITSKYLRNPIIIKKTTGRQAAVNVEQQYILVNERDKLEVLKRILLVREDFHGLIFCRTREEAGELAVFLNKAGIASDALHGDKAQRDRERILDLFRKRQLRIVVATDVAARGIDVKDLTHVINWSLPWDVESYIHRIGRTGRSNSKGLAIALVSPSQMGALRKIEKMTKTQITKIDPPGHQEIQKYLLEKMFAKMEKVFTNERIAERVKALAEVLELPPFLEGMSPQEMLLMLAAQYQPEIFRHAKIEAPTAEQQSYAGRKRERGGRPPPFRRRR